jgi:hypothetical protein
MSTTSTTNSPKGVLLDDAIQSLSASTGLQASVAVDKSNGRKGIDGIAVISDGRKRWRFSIELKGQLNSHTLGSAIAAVSKYKREHGPTALVASYINPSQAEKLRDLGVEFFDTAGNVFLKQEGLHVFVSGRKARDSNTRGSRPARAFNATGSRLIFALLCNPGLEEKPYRQLAKEAGISLGAVNWIMSDLKSLGHLIDNGKRGRRIQNRKELMKRWVAAYPEQLRPKLLIGRYHKEGAQDWWRKAELPPDAFWGGETGAALITRHLRPEAVTIYSETNLAKLQAQHGLRRDSNGETELLRRFWAFDRWDEQGKHVVPPLLIYADLIRTANDRNLETAEILYDQCIARLVE